MLKIRINQVPALIELCRHSQNNLLIVGNPGVGKSQVIGSLASDHCKITMMTGSSTYEETVNGIPRDNKETKRQDYTRPEWFVEMLEWAETHNTKEDYQILFVDEFNTADPQVLKTFLSILTERKIPTQPESLPEHVVMVAAMNPCNQNEGEELIRPMASRFITVEIDSSIDVYKEYILGNNQQSDKIFELTSTPSDLSDERKCAYLEQVLPEDWHKFDDGAYHEINPRSMSNFFRAMAWAKNPEALSPKLSQAFFGRTYKYPDDEATKKTRAEKRAKDIKKGSVVPSLKELEQMSSEDLKTLKVQMMSKGAAGATCIANIVQVLMSRGDYK